MDGHAEESDEDHRGECKTVVLWQKHFQQRIVFDLSDDESLHLSDLDRAVDLRISQSESEPSINLDMSAELSDLEDTSSDSSVDQSQSDVVGQSRGTGSFLPVSAQRADTIQVPVTEQREDPGQNTSDEEQEELPYDGHLSSFYFHQTSSPEGNSSSDGTVQASPDGVDFATIEKDSEVKPGVSPMLSQKDEGEQLLDINQVLLRHFSHEQLQLAGRLIEAETLPEVSLLDSATDVLTSRAVTLNSKQAERTPMSGQDLNQHREATDDDRSLTAMEEKHFTAREQEEALDATKPDASDEGPPKVSLTRTRSFSDIKYGQGQVHYPRPDFSKVAPKVKIPKAASGPAKPGPPASSTMHRAQSSPGMLDLISRVLEDSVQPSEKPHIFRDPEKPTVPAHRLQADYDDLLTKYAEAVSDELRTQQAHTTSNTDLVVGQGQGRSVGRRHLGTFPPQISGGLMNLPAEGQPEGQGASAGEEMTAELMVIIGHFMLTVEEFKQSVSIKAFSLEEQQMMLRNMKEAQDQLERKYMSKKEEHRALEMQNYMGLNRNTGIFDPERLLEGDIFRAGMLLDDIKEMVDKHLCEQDCGQCLEPRLGNTAAHTQHEIVPQFQALTEAATTHTCAKEKEGDKASTEARSGRRSAGIKLVNELTIKPEDMNNSVDTLRSRTRVSVFGPQTSAGEDEEGNDEEDRSSIYSEGIVSSDIIAYLTGAKLSREQTAAQSEQGRDLSSGEKSESHHSQNHSTCKHPAPPLTPSTSQVIVSYETDSGFGSSYLTQSGTFQSSPISERGQSDSLSGSDSESCSNLWTTIHPACQSGPLQSQTPAAVELWVQSTKTEASVRQRGPDISQHLCEANMEAAQRERQLCSCNSEAIVALQLEVSRLKQELKEGLVQLPQLAQKMDYLTSKYRQERRSRTRTRNHQRPSSLGKHRSRVNVRVDDWISTDMDPSRSKDIDDDTGGSESELQFDASPARGDRGSIISEFQHVLQRTLQSSKDGIQTENASAVTRLRLKGERSSRVRLRTQNRDTKDFNLDDPWSLVSSPSPQRPLLQVNYGSSSSLPASYKYSEPPVQSVRHHMKRSTQSDSALLPSDVYFLRTPSPAAKTGRRRDSKEEAMNRTLDQAIEVARSMKRTTDRMARTLSADLAKAEHRRKIYNDQPSGGARHQFS
ncbi:uncharacterized protein LOC128769197 isoform X2 [Synchiropus splendidus]|uniref:uncharacterized protein LOC128769197 isoform X2 n=1 Tax=Synchiropus splendidus TaxID=270530 RepID=UPI00237DE236|nr:uncharacterized protein LOC128769197 isoform X2 [Synchiropus splendidus]